MVSRNVSRRVSQRARLEKFIKFYKILVRPWGAQGTLPRGPQGAPWASLAPPGPHLGTPFPFRNRNMRQLDFRKWSAETKGLVWGACCAERRALKILERALKILDRGVKFHRASLGVHGALQNSQDASVFRDFARGKFSEILERARKSLENFFAQKFFFFPRK